jgi:hypothetical protein
MPCNKVLPLVMCRLLAHRCADQGLAPADEPSRPHTTGSVFRPFHSSYDGSPFGYAAAGTAIAFSLLAGTFMLIVNPRRSAGLLRVASDAAGMLACIGIAASVNDRDALRYACPFFIALASTRLLFPLSEQRRRSNSPFALLAPKAAITAIAAAQFAVLLIFAHNLFDRVMRIATQHTANSLVFDWVRDLETTALSDRARDYIRSIQEKTPPDSTIWAWVDTPFHFDFRRNKIWHFHNGWFVAPWRINASTSDSLKQELVRRGVHYILWQYKSEWIPSISLLRKLVPLHQRPIEWRIIEENTLKLLVSLQGLASSSDIIFDDGTSVLIQIGR